MSAWWYVHKGEEFKGPPIPVVVAGRSPVHPGLVHHHLERVLPTRLLTHPMRPLQFAVRCRIALRRDGHALRGHAHVQGAGELLRHTGGSAGADDSTIATVTVTVPSANEDLGPATLENYTLTVNGTRVIITSKTIYGAWHGLETVVQLVGNAASTGQDGGWGHGPRTGGWLEKDQLVVEDGPEFSNDDNNNKSHRGLMIATWRNYLDLPTIKRLVAGMAMLKANVLQWHLVERPVLPGQNPAFPAMADQSAFAPAAVYTPANLAEVVAYVGARGVRVMPETEYAESYARHPPGPPRRPNVRCVGPDARSSLYIHSVHVRTAATVVCLDAAGCNDRAAATAVGPRLGFTLPLPRRSSPRDPCVTQHCSVPGHRTSRPASRSRAMQQLNLSTCPGVLNPTLDETYELLLQLLTELTSIFTEPTFFVGGCVADRHHAPANPRRRLSSFGPGMLNKIAGPRTKPDLNLPVFSIHQPQRRGQIPML